MDTIETKEKLLNLLPHGSGIDGDWTIFQKNNPNVYYASNFYHAMDEFGFYDRCYDFTLKYQYNGENQTEPCNICDGEGIRNIEDFRSKYHSKMTKSEIISFLSEQRGYGHLKETDIEFKCAYCSGSGILKISEFTLLNINLHGQYIKQYLGDLKDYLFQVCDIWE